MKIIAILAMTQKRVIGHNNGLAWHIPEDLKHFKNLTTGHTVVMGRNTYFSLPEKFRPLPDRRNIVITHHPIPDIECYTSIREFLENLSGNWRQNSKNFKNSENLLSEKIFLIGGASLYNQFFEQNLVDGIELTLLKDDFDGNVIIDEFRENFLEISRTAFDQGYFISLIHKKYE